MNNPTLVKVKAGSNHNFAGLASTRGNSLKLEKPLKACALMDHAIDCAAAAHEGVGGIDDYIDI